MKLFASAGETLKKYADFSGRASREEFWCFFAFVIIANAVARIIGVVLGGGPALSGAVGLLLLIPQLAVAVRRLHDVGKSGRELAVPCAMMLLVPVAFAFRGVLAPDRRTRFPWGCSARLRPSPHPLPQEGHDDPEPIRGGADSLFVREVRIAWLSCRRWLAS